MPVTAVALAAQRQHMPPRVVALFPRNLWAVDLGQQWPRYQTANELMEYVELVAASLGPGHVAVVWGRGDAANLVEIEPERKGDQND